MTSRTITNNLSCPSCDHRSFEIRINGEEEIGLAHCLACAKDFLLFDSEDYWYDYIQETYPRVRRCGCKSESFELASSYVLRDDGDVRKIDLHSTCTECGHEKRQLRIDIDYSPTEDLIQLPLRYCAAPKLIVALQEFSLCVSPTDMASIASYLHEQHGCSFVGECWRDGKREWLELSQQEVTEAILANQYLRIYAAPPAALPSLPLKLTAREEAALWKRLEAIRISAPVGYVMGFEPGLLYYINFANEFVANEKIISKDTAFNEMTAALRTWLGTRFVTLRGKRSFDNPEEHKRLYGDRFLR